MQRKRNDLRRGDRPQKGENSNVAFAPQPRRQGPFWIIQHYMVAYVGHRHGFPSPSPSAPRSRRVLRSGAEHQANLVELVTSEGFFVGIISEAGIALRPGDLFLAELTSDYLLARVESNHPIRQLSRLVRFEPVEIEGSEFRWAIEDGLRLGKSRRFRSMRCAPLRVKNEEEALAIFQKVDAKTAESEKPREEKLDTENYDLENAKWKVLRDIHGQVIRALEKLDDTTVNEETALTDASTQFAVDVMARTGLRLHPVEGLTAVKRKSLARRCRKMKNTALRHLVQYWLKHGYNNLHASDLSGVLFSETGIAISPAALTKARERLGLTTRAAGRPSVG